MDGKTAAEAIVAAGYAPRSAERNVAQVLNNPIIKATIAEIFDKAGLSDDAIANQLRDLSKATKKTYFASHGKVCDEREDPDHSTLLATIGLTAKIKGIIDKSANLNVNVDISPVDMSVYQQPTSHVTQSIA